MKNLTFHLPEYCGKIIIESEADKNLMDTEKSADELKEILAGNLPSGMYTEFVEKVVGEYLTKSCDVPTLEKLKEAIDSSKISYAKGFDLYRIVKRIITERGREE
jgi:hypothetical protein